MFGNLIALCLVCSIGQLPTGEEASPTEESKSPARESDPQIEKIEALLNEAIEKEKSKDPDGARRLLDDVVKQLAMLPNAVEREDVVELFWQAGYVAYRTGALQVAHDAWERVLKFRTSKLPEDHPCLFEKGPGALGVRPNG